MRPLHEGLLMHHYQRPPIELVCYTAGLLDGEGSIGIAGNRFNVSISQSEVNGGEALFARLRDEWGGLGSLFQSKPRSEYRQKHAVWIWTLGGVHQVEHVINHTLPYLRVKRGAAERLLKAIEDHHGRREWSHGEIAFLRENADASSTWIARKLDRSPSGVRHQRRKL